jgi:16S rRNA G966 N2-methylase RsmD
LRSFLVGLESWWFDRIHGTDTAASKAELSGAGHDSREGFWYIPTRPSVARRIFRALPIQDFGQFTFVDVGCGKGRMLCLAIRCNFRSIIGVERDVRLSTIAASNIANLQDPRLSIQQTDARAYQFPDTPLVLYLFNPFGENILQLFFSNLENSLMVQPRQVIVALLYPEYAYVLERFSRYKLISHTSQCRIYSC